MPGSRAAQKAHWERAGYVGYRNSMYVAPSVAEHVTRRMWSIAIKTGRDIGLAPSGSVLDLGCGDGAFANAELGRQFARVHGADFAVSAIERARAESVGSHVTFERRDLTSVKALSAMGGPYDGAFLMGILHHVKAVVPRLLRQLGPIAPRVVVLEPNGDNLLRKALELTPRYRAAGEDSFGTKELIGLFEAAGFRCVIWRRLNLFPNFTPALIYRALRPIEPLVERTPILRALCTVNIFGFAHREIF